MSTKDAHFKKSQRKAEIQKLQSKEIDPKLTENINGLRALVTIATLLQNGAFASNAHQAVAQSTAFVMNLHAQLTDETIKHPDAKLVPQLLEVIKEKEKLAKKAAKAEKTQAKTKLQAVSTETQHA